MLAPAHLSFIDLLHYLALIGGAFTLTWGGIHILNTFWVRTGKEAYINIILKILLGLACVIIGGFLVIYAVSRLSGFTL